MRVLVLVKERSAVLQPPIDAKAIQDAATLAAVAAVKPIADAAAADAAVAVADAAQAQADAAIATQKAVFATQTANTAKNAAEGLAENLALNGLSDAQNTAVAQTFMGASDLAYATLQTQVGKNSAAIQTATVKITDLEAFREDVTAVVNAHDETLDTLVTKGYAVEV